LLDEKNEKKRKKTWKSRSCKEKPKKGEVEEAGGRLWGEAAKKRQAELVVGGGINPGLVRREERREGESSGKKKRGENLGFQERKNPPG